QQVRKH
ncbi:carbohydrate binding domain protein, partial [Vibrio parahaemolyticus V-223/04]